MIINDDVCLVYFSEYESHLRDTWDYVMIDSEIVCYALSVDVAFEYDPCLYANMNKYKIIPRCYDLWMFCILYILLRMSVMW